MGKLCKTLKTSKGIFYLHDVLLLHHVSVLSCNSPNEHQPLILLQTWWVEDAGKDLGSKKRLHIKSVSQLSGHSFTVSLNSAASKPKSHLMCLVSYPDFDLSSQQHSIRPPSESITSRPAELQPVHGLKTLHITARPRWEETTGVRRRRSEDASSLWLAGWLLAGWDPLGPGFGWQPRSMWPKFRCEWEAVSRRGRCKWAQTMWGLWRIWEPGPHVHWRSLMSSKWISRTRVQAPCPSCRPAAKWILRVPRGPEPGASHLWELAVESQTASKQIKWAT